MAGKAPRHVVVVDPADWPELTKSEVNKKLVQACTLRHVPIAKQAISQGANVNCRRSDSMTPLHIAAEHGDVDLIRLLCDQPNVRIESKTMHGLTALHTAALLGHTGAMRTLLAYGAGADCEDNLGRRPLHYAALQRDTDSARVLIRRDASVNVYDVFHESPLYTSVIRRPHLPMTRLLLSNGATAASGPRKNSLGLLLEAVLCVSADLEILKLLFRHESSVNTTEPIGLRTPLHIAAINGNLTVATLVN